MPSDAINNIISALEVSPDNIPLRLYLARLYADERLWPESTREYKRVLQSAPDNTDALYGLAQCSYEQQELSQAIVTLEHLLQTDPRHREAGILYCRALLRDGSIGQAIEAYQQLLHYYPSFVDEELDRALKVPGTPQPQTPEEEQRQMLELGDKEFIERPSINFSQVGGMQRVKEEIDLKIIKPLEFKELYAAYGKKAGGGILLYGPPGCGKTHIARATAGQVSASFLSIGINDVMDMWLGKSERNLHAFFEMARANTPCVIFFDEIDALGANRKDIRNAENRHLINQFLSEMDGIEANNDGLLIIGATNAPWHLDPAFRRPGRFDRIIFVDPPDAEGRESILKILLSGKPVDDMDYKALAKASAEFSGADLKAVVDVAIERKLSDAFKTGVPAPLSTKDLSQSIKSLRPTTKEWFTTARNYALYANESGLYDEILTYLKLKK